MKLQNTSKEANKIIEEQRDAILNLIDTKIENDMKEVISEIKSVKNEIKIIYWVVGVAMAIIFIILAFIALKK